MPREPCLEPRSVGCAYLPLGAVKPSLPLGTVWAQAGKFSSFRRGGSKIPSPRAQAEEQQVYHVSSVLRETLRDGSCLLALS